VAGYLNFWLFPQW